MDTSPRASSAVPATESTWEDFLPGDSLFASPDAIFHGRGCRLRDAPIRDIGNRAAALLAQAATQAEGGAGPVPILLGLLPFDPAEPAQLMIPRVLRRMARPQALPALSPVAVLDRHEWPTGAAYEDGVKRALARLKADPGLRKVVLARTLHLNLAAPVDLASTLARLWQRNPDGYTYALPLDAENNHLLIGASPELLVRRAGRRVFVHPLAGTAVRHADREQDMRSAQALLQSAKDQQEHAVVVEAVEQALRPLCARLAVPPRPTLTATDRLWHLGTPIVGELADPAIHALDLAIALHPTPAVCGLPVASARRAIADIEPFKRGYYAGAVGWCDARGDGAWAVAIRCAEVANTHLTLFAGAGIVPGSIPRQERLETGNKLRTILDALGLEPDL